MIEVVAGNSSRSLSSGGHVPGATLRRLEDESDVNLPPKSNAVVRVVDAVQRCGTTASDCDAARESSESFPVKGSASSAEPDDGSYSDDSSQSLESEQSSDLVIFDYDDTILPTYALACAQKHSVGQQLVDPNTIRDELDRLTDAVLVNLNNVVRVATLVVVTNASSDWVMQSCERYLPRIGEFFAEHNIRIISARDRLDNSLLAQKHWKYFVFIDLIEEQFIDKLKSGEPFTVTSIGDGAEERQACMKLASIFKNQKWVFKNLKLLTQPTLGCLIQQHLLLAKSFDNFFEMKTSADLCILFDKKKSQSDV
ncbi:hypothetical protein, conserved [Babesia bigemina]|uniref:Uncharacterized protein n=1 Tax=Babesia bigemina TaxID=5866 RepID=A0A061DEW8_BABBI|nr:hypothetical protein, conserved [Babesia bigemina]CDR98005.1 hypothetical protein, conserved [Babesia bigemina]|eukprot:XP_012770191.1 hypothetical protein, conserved [Babesia bigemina]